MSTLLLSFLLIFLLAVGMLMSSQVRERFENEHEEKKVEASPALMNLMKPIQTGVVKAVPQVDVLAREQETRCPPPPECPDMSRYIKLDEIPCWNCSLP